MPSRAIKSLLAFVPDVLAAVAAEIADEERGEDESIKVAGVLTDATAAAGDRVGLVVSKSPLEEEASFLWP